GYKTDDVGFVYQGRGDHQIKIRGFRVELGEVQSALLKCAGVTDAAVRMVKEESDGILEAYVAGEDLKVEDLRKELASPLPDYMIPGRFIFVSKIAMTPQSKVDWATM